MRNHKLKLHLNNTGDTIVEVLIATVVASAVIVGAFTIANKSAQQIRQAQERSEALKIASSAVETVRGRASAAMSIAVNIPVCMDLATQAITGTDMPLPSLQEDSNDDYNATCRTIPSAGTEYYTSITRRVDSGVSSFEIHTRWDKLNGGERQDVTFTYRLDR